METNGALVNLLEMLFSALINILGGPIFFCRKCHHIFLIMDGSYGGYSGPGWGRGVRNLNFHTSDPNAGVETWIRLHEGEIRARVILDDQYGR